VHHAAIADQLAVVAFLAEAGADLSAADHEGLSALHCCRSRAVAASLLRHGANPWAKNKLGVTPAMFLDAAGQKAVARFIDDTCGL
jgi:ankyrin repeat protein